MYNILLLLAECDTEDCMDPPLKIHMREYYYLKSQTRYPDNSMNMEEISDKNTNEYYKAVGNNISSLIKGTHESWFKGSILIVTSDFSGLGSTDIYFWSQYTYRNSYF